MKSFVNIYTKRSKDRHNILGHACQSCAIFSRSRNSGISNRFRASLNIVAFNDQIRKKENK